MIYLHKKARSILENITYSHFRGKIKHLNTNLKFIQWRENLKKWFSFFEQMDVAFVVFVLFPLYPWWCSFKMSHWNNWYFLFELITSRNVLQTYSITQLNCYYITFNMLSGKIRGPGFEPRRGPIIWFIS